MLLTIVAKIPPTSATTDKVKGMPMIPKRRQNRRPWNVDGAIFPYPKINKLANGAMKQPQNITYSSENCCGKENRL